MAPAAALLLLCCLVLASSGSEDVCNQRAAVGDSVTIPLNYKLKDSDSLKWKYKNTVIFHRKNKATILSRTDCDADDTGVLKLTNVNKANEGRYIPEVFDTNGKSGPKFNGIHLCVLERVQKPLVKTTCKDSQKMVEFNCTAVEKNMAITYEWLLDDQVVGSTKVLRKEAATVQEAEFKCKVSNGVSSMISNPITQTCYTPVGFTWPEQLFGINIWILVGTGGGIVLLLIIMVIICCLRARRTKRMRLKDEEELRLEFTNPEQRHEYLHPADRHPHQHQQHHQHRHHHQQQPAGHTGPRQHRSKQHRKQPLPRTPDQPNGQPQPSPRRAAQVGQRGAAESTAKATKLPDDEQPPPLPQPRKKAPRKV